MEKREKNDRIEAEDRAVYCFGTAKLFENRRKSLRFFNKINKYIGLFIPLSFGFFFMSLKSSSLMPTLEPIFLSITTLLNASLLFISLWALVNDWDVRLENYTESISNNRQYFKVFKEISERYDEKPTEYAAKLKEMILLDDMQQKKDDKENFSAKDNRFITRQGLYQLQLECPKCGNIPSIEKPKTCENCGI